MGIPPTPNVGMPDAPERPTLWGSLTKAIGRILKPEKDLTQLVIGTDAEARDTALGADRAGDDWRTIAEWAYEKMRLEAGRNAAYRDYDMMDNEVPEVSSALDVIAEFATQEAEAEETFKIESDDQALADHLNEICDNLKLRDIVTPIAREVAKYGGTFLELVAAESTQQIIACKPLDPTTMQRNEDKNGQLMQTAFTQYEMTKGEAVAKFQAWQIAHFRYRRMLTRMYGNSFLESARRVWKQLNLMEDGMVLARLYRSHMRYVFQIPVDGIAADGVQAYINKIKKQFRKRIRYNAQTQRLELYDSPLSADEDFFLPTRKDSVSSVKGLQGQGNLSNIGDIQHFHNKLFTALKVPKALLGIERDVNAKATLSEQDVNFARGIRGLQKALADEIRVILRRVLVLDGIDPDKLKEWKIVFPQISTVDLALQWEVEQLKANVAVIYHSQLGLLNDEYIYSHYLDLTPEEIKKQQDAQDDNPPAQRAQNALARAKAMGAAGTNGNAPGQMPGQQPPNPNKPPRGFTLKAPNQLTPSESDFSAIKRIRSLLKVSLTEPVMPGEVLLVRRLDEMRREFGAVQIEEKVFRGLLEEARRGSNGNQ